MSINFFKNGFDLNKFLLNLNKKKQYFNQLENQVLFLDKIKKTNYKILNLNLNNKILYSKNTTVTYILSVYFSRSNTILSVIDYSGNSKFFIQQVILVREVVLKHLG